MQSLALIEPETHRRTDVFSKVWTRADKQYPYTFLGCFRSSGNCAHRASDDYEIDLAHNWNPSRALMHILGAEGWTREQG